MAGGNCLSRRARYFPIDRSVPTLLCPREGKVRVTEATPNPTLKRTVAGGARLRSLLILFAPARPTGNRRLTQR